MIKSTFLFLSIFLLAIFLTQCEKIESHSDKNTSKNKVEFHDNQKANTCGCSATCFWSSCSVSGCTVNAGGCTAACGCGTVWIIGIIPAGTVAFCGCGSIGWGNLFSSVLSNENEKHFILAKSWIKGWTGPRIGKLRSKINKVLAIHRSNKNGKEIALTFALEEFVEAVSNLNETEGKFISSKIIEECGKCGASYQ